MAGPFALPLVWMHPRYDISRKILVTVIVLIVTYALLVAMGVAGLLGARQRRRS